MTGILPVNTLQLRQEAVDLWTQLAGSEQANVSQTQADTVVEGSLSGVTRLAYPLGMASFTQPPPKDAGVSAERSPLSQSTCQITLERFPVPQRTGERLDAMQSSRHPRLDPAFAHGQVLKRDAWSLLHFPSFLL